MDRLKRLLCLISVLLLLLGCCGCDKGQKQYITCRDDMKNMQLRIGFPDDLDLQDDILSLCPEATLLPQNDIMALNAVISGKLDCFITGKYALDGYLEANPDSGLMLLDEPLKVVNTALGLSASTPVDNYVARVNECIEMLKSSGVIDDMKRRWITEGNETMPVIELPEDPSYVLRVVTFGEIKPSTYIKDNKVVGFDIELAYRVAQYLDCGLTIELASFPSMLMGVSEGKYDMIASNLFITEERSDNMIFSVPYESDPISICVKAPPASQASYNTLDDLKNAKKFAAVTGTINDAISEKYFPGCELVYFKGLMDAVTGVSAGKAEVLLYDEPTLKYICAVNENLKLIPERVVLDDYYFISSREEQGRRLISEFNEWLKTAKADGVIDEMEKFWTGTEAPDGRCKTDDLTGENGVLTISFFSASRPESYYYQNRPVGFTIDVALAFCRDRGYKAEFVATDTESFIYGVQTGKFDLHAGFTSYTEERAENVCYSDVVLNGGVVAMVRDSSAATGQRSVWKSFQNTFIKESRWKMLLSGLGVTAIVTLGGFALANVMGALFCSMEMSRRKPLNILADIYSKIMQGTPIVVLLMFLYYVVFAKSTISGTIVAILGFGLSSGASMAQLFHGGIAAVNKGQSEASLALGFTKTETFLGIVLPQAVRTMLPGYFSSLVAMMKLTSIVGYIAVVDLTKSGDIIRSSTYEAFFPLIAVGVVYFIISYILLGLMNMIRKKLEPRRVTKTEVNGK